MSLIYEWQNLTEYHNYIIIINVIEKAEKWFYSKLTDWLSDNDYTVALLSVTDVTYLRIESGYRKALLDKKW